jgi:cyclopropane fatty-acyl-phospholipid synthase-like methyltransferase
VIPIPLNWYEDFFHGVALDLWRKAISPQQTTAEGEFLRQNLDCEPGAHVLDVPCGNGRLSFELAKHGYRVTGVDISKEFIEEARASIAGMINPSATAGGTDQVDFILGDMRRIEGDSIYDAAYCFGNSFGFLEYADMERFLQGVQHALKPGKRFVVETGMAAESVLPDFKEQTRKDIWRKRAASTANTFSSRTESPSRARPNIGFTPPPKSGACLSAPDSPSSRPTAR